MPQLKVIRASAGSGKTFALTGEYLRLLFTERDYFRHILAVTFTNKATEEMKTRIIRELHLLGSHKPSNHLDLLINATGLPENQLRRQAGIILKRLLHQYSDFSVSTIDSFFQRIIRSFTRELGIQGGYSIELDTETLLSELITRLLTLAETDKPLLTWLSSFAESLIEKGENWNFRKSMQNLGREIFKEDFKTLPGDALARFSDRDFLKEYQSELYVIVNGISADYRSFGVRAAEILEANGLSVDDFSRKGAGPAGFLLKLASGEFKEPTKTSIDAASSIEKWVTKTSPRKDEIIQVAENELMPLIGRTVDFFAATIEKYSTAQVILKNMYTLGILSDLSKLSYDWCNENNAFLLPEAPVFLNKIIDGNDTPFIYEKAGYWYHHFMIDEFQDTSWLQWMNFRPLISNSLSQGFDNLVVGDVKQSVYRWRNSNWEILAGKLGNDFPREVISNQSLNRNWRSCKQIVEFNNAFFSTASVLLNDEHAIKMQEAGYMPIHKEEETIAGLYAGAAQVQENAGKPGGIIRVEFIETDADNTFYESVNNKLVRLLIELQDQGYPLSDIAIITRKNKEAKQLAEFLLAYALENADGVHRFDVISDEALRLGSSGVVTFLTALIQYMVTPEEPVNIYYLLSGYQNYFSTPGTSDDWQRAENDSKKRMEEFKNLFPAAFFELVASSGAFSLTEIIEQLIALFRLSDNIGEQVYLQAFRDLVMEYSRRYSSDPAKFMEYWNENGKEKSVAAPAGQDAIRILTIHKSKGLEFDLVIIPYCNWELNTHKSILWGKPAGNPFSKMKILPLSYSPQLCQTAFAGDYYNELQKQYIDNLNLLYVAFTRACDGLFVFCKSGKTAQLKSVSDLSAKVINSLSPGSETTFTRGEMPVYRKGGQPRQGEVIPVGTVIKPAFPGRIKLAFQPTGPVNEGKLLHEIFSSIHVAEDVDRAVTGLFLQGKISQPERENYIHVIRHKLNDIQVMSWFSKEWHTVTEAEIILPGGTIRRPDRVMIREGEALVIDYKFGLREVTVYEEQLKTYAGLLRDMGYRKVEAYLWYVMLEKVVRCGPDSYRE
jgi:ATP-dependent helicase/nuclease subunit A